MLRNSLSRIEGAASKVIGILVVSIVPFAFVLWAGISMFERFKEIQASPDLNLDGEFTVLDLPNAVGSILLEVGHRYQALLAESKIGPFLEMSSDSPSLFWSLVFAGFTYFLILVWPLLVLDENGKL